jgi:GNAT superfamily N-acetyltransferase
VYGVARRGLQSFLERVGDSWPYDPADDPDWEPHWLPLYAHLQATADLAWLAERDGATVGYARSIRRGDVRELTEFFMEPDAAGQGIGRQLLELAFPAGDAAHRMIIATTHPSAQARYIRHGFRAHGALMDVRGAPVPTAVSTDLAARPIDPADAADLAVLAAIDTEILHGPRDDDQRWFGAHRRGRLFLRDGRPVGYGWVGWWAGPVAALDPADLPAMLAELERVAVDDGRTELGWWVPSMAHHALVHLLGRGYRLDSVPPLLMSDGPTLPGAFDRYVATSPPFFV